MIGSSCRVLFRVLFKLFVLFRSRGEVGRLITLLILSQRTLKRECERKDPYEINFKIRIDVSAAAATSVAIADAFGDYFGAFCGTPTRF